MNNQDYEQKKRECWEEYLAFNDEEYSKSAFSYAFDRAYALGKQEKGADTVIQGWVCRDADGFLSLYKDKPTRDTCDLDDVPYGIWSDNTDSHMELPITSFPDLTWESEPQECEIIIKRKKK